MTASCSEENHVFSRTSSKCECGKVEKPPSEYIREPEFLGDYETDKGIRITIERAYIREGKVFYIACLFENPSVRYHFDVNGDPVYNYGLGKIIRQRRGIEDWFKDVQRKESSINWIESCENIEGARKEEK